MTENDMPTDPDGVTEDDLDEPIANVEIHGAVDAGMEPRVVVARRAKRKGGFSALPLFSSEQSVQEHLDYLRGDR